MKKNISINISGIIFHIEEDGYEQLSEYLGSINKYFASFEDSAEIVADIESRIAEIFLSKLNEGKQVITAEDVSSLITTMGSIQDFQAVEDETVVVVEETEFGEESETFSETTGQKKRLFRDLKQRLIGGVASGIANYFSIDPLWIRLIFIILLFDVFLTFSLSALIILTYIVLWIVVPGSYTLTEDKKIKKIYRNPDGSVIAGVANGIAAYFNIDVTVVRVLFVVTTFAGLLGLFAYIVLWIILPEAKTITDKVQMTGEEVTLENIEQNIIATEEKKRLETEESTLVKVLLFPFRLIARILRGLAYALGPILRFLVEAARVVAGLILVLMGMAFLFAVLVSGAVFLGIMTGEGLIHMGDFPVELFYDTFPPLGIAAAMIVGGVPALAFILIGLSILSKSRVGSPTVGWTMFAVWLFGLIGLSFVLPKVIFQFKDEGSYTETVYFDNNDDVLVLDTNMNGFEDYREPRLKLRGYDGEQIKLVQDFSARGGSRQMAMDQAELMEYEVRQDGSRLIFDSNFEYGEGSLFRDQELRMTLYIPFGQEFIMEDGFDELIYYSFSYQGYRTSDILDNTWVYNPSGLDCITCDKQPSYEEERRESFEEQFNENMDVRGYYKEFELSSFDELVIDGPFDLNLVQGDEYRIVVSGRQAYVDTAIIEKNDQQLFIHFDGEERDIHRYDQRMSVKIICPNLNNIQLKGSSNGSIRGFEEESMFIKLTGAAELILDADIDNVAIELSGASRLDLVGRGEELTANLSTASYLDSYGFKVENAEIKASGASKVKVYASDLLEIKASLISEVKYRGGAKVITDDNVSMDNIEEQ